MFWRWFEQALPGLFRDRGYDYGALRLALDAHIPREHWGWYFDRAVDVIGVIHQTRQK